MNSENIDTSNIETFRQKMKNKRACTDSTKIRNRRFKKLEELIEKGDYFSETNIKMRHPLIYDLYIGRFERNELNGFNMKTLPQVWALLSL